MATEADLEIFSGDTLDISVNVTDQSNVAVDLTGSDVLWQLAKADWKTNPVPIVLKSSAVAGEIIVTPGTGGNFVVKLLSGDTTGMPAGTYYHESQVTLADGTIGTTTTGKFKVKANLIDPR